MLGIPPPRHLVAKSPYKCQEHGLARNGRAAHEPFVLRQFVEFVTAVKAGLLLNEPVSVGEFSGREQRLAGCPVLSTVGHVLHTRKSSLYNQRRSARKTLKSMV